MIIVTIFQAKTDRFRPKTEQAATAFTLRKIYFIYPPLIPIA